MTQIKTQIKNYKIAYLFHIYCAIYCVSYTNTVNLYYTNTTAVAIYGEISNTSYELGARLFVLF